MASKKEAPLPVGDKPLDIAPGLDSDFPGDKIIAEEKAKGTALQTIDYGKYAGAGKENVTREEFTVPFIRILQANSPQCRPPEAGGIDGAKAGMIINTGTGELFDGKIGVSFVPVYRRRNFVEFYPRPPNGPGGFIGLLETSDPRILQLRAEQGEFGKLISKDNEGQATEISEVCALYAILSANDMESMVIAPFGSTQIKKYRNFVTRVMSIKYKGTDPVTGKPIIIDPALFAHEWRLSTVYEQKGENSWYGWKLGLREEPAIKSRLDQDSWLFGQAATFYDLITSGAAKADFAGAAETEAGAHEPDDGPNM